MSASSAVDADAALRPPGPNRTLNARRLVCLFPLAGRSQ